MHKGLCYWLGASHSLRVVLTIAMFYYLVCTSKLKIRKEINKLKQKEIYKKEIKSKN